MNQLFSCRQSTSSRNADPDTVSAQIMGLLREVRS